MSDEEEFGHAVNPMSSISRDVRNARVNSGAVAGEVREFLAQMQGKSPQEMLGMVAQSSLIKCTVQAVGVMLALMVVFTVIPFGLAKISGEGASKAKAEEAKASPPPAEKEKPESGTEASPGTDPDEDLPGEKDDLLDKLGVGETKVAPPKENPLESSADDLFKDLQ
jgi:flagellar biosynthesis/type III secretory pathway M-ring protein FliF/YscJ